MILAHIAGVPVQESLAFVLPVVLVVGFIYWSSYRERRRARGGAEEAEEPSKVADCPSGADRQSPRGSPQRG